MSSSFLRHYDETKTLSYAILLISPTWSDGIQTLTFISISFEVFAKDTVYRCLTVEFRDLKREYPNWWGNPTLKVEDPIFGERKLFLRKEGVWERLCTQREDVITDDTFKCFKPLIPNNTNYLGIFNKYYFD